MDDSRQIMEEVLAASRGGAPVAVATVMRAPASTPSPPAPLPRSEGEGSSTPPLSPPRGGEGNEEYSAIALGAKILVRADGSRVGSMGGGALEEAVAADCQEALTKRPREQVLSLFYSATGEHVQRLDATENEIEVMIEVVESPATLLIVGGGHVGQSIGEIASQAGFSVVVLDDREAFANAERFPMADRVICGDFVEELRRFPIDGNTYIVCVSRGHKQDELSLREVASSDAAYVGMIGSVRRVSTVLTHLAREGVSRDALDRVHTPIGLDIGAETPEEIAVSIVAELVLVRRGGTGRKLSEVRRVRVGE